MENIRYEFQNSLYIFYIFLTFRLTCHMYNVIYSNAAWLHAGCFPWRLQRSLPSAVLFISIWPDANISTAARRYYSLGVDGVCAVCHWRRYPSRNHYDLVSSQLSDSSFPFFSSLYPCPPLSLSRPACPSLSLFYSFKPNINLVGSIRRGEHDLLFSFRTGTAVSSNCYLSTSFRYRSLTSGRIFHR